MIFTEIYTKKRLITKFLAQWPKRLADIWNVKVCRARFSSLWPQRSPAGPVATFRCGGWVQFCRGAEFDVLMCATSDHVDKNSWDSLFFLRRMGPNWSHKMSPPFSDFLSEGATGAYEVLSLHPTWTGCSAWHGKRAQGYLEQDEVWIPMVGCMTTITTYTYIHHLLTVAHVVFFAWMWRVVCRHTVLVKGVHLQSTPICLA